ncbi:hypothetical protein [Nostoc sp.]|uniref:hypothetical protein n=1 Tax=Nostoc sp. TaxID=1180 RepID=UPI002FF8854A
MTVKPYIQILTSTKLQLQIILPCPQCPMPHAQCPMPNAPSSTSGEVGNYSC